MVSSVLECLVVASCWSRRRDIDRDGVVEKWYVLVRSGTYFGCCSHRLSSLRSRESRAYDPEVTAFRRNKSDGGRW